jgi:uncharacterized alkaline shock family protein YloU
MNEKLPTNLSESSDRIAPEQGLGMSDPIIGTIAIAPQVVFSLAQNAALSTYGVVGIASRYTGADNTHRDIHRGLDVQVLEPNEASQGRKRVKVDIHVIVDYGVRIPAVTNSLQRQIEYSIQHSTGYVLEEIHIHVAGVRVNGD